MSHLHEGPVAEVERKWVLKSFPQLPVSRSREIWHYYTPEGRVTRDLYPNGESKFVLCVKKPLEVAGGNSEDEHEIYWEEFLTRIGDSVPLRKTRHDIQIGERTWEVDVFIDICLIMAEVEWIFPLESIDEEEVKNFQVPEEMKKHIIVEVTGMKEYSNYSLSKQ